MPCSHSMLTRIAVTKEQKRDLAFRSGLLFEILRRLAPVSSITDNTPPSVHSSAQSGQKERQNSLRRFPDA